MSSYPGGKSGCGVYHRLAMEIPPHDVRIAPFLGRCAITRLVKPAPLTIGIEIDEAVLDQWSAEECRRFDLRLGDGVAFLHTYFNLNHWPPVAPELSPPEALAAVYGGAGHDGVPFIFIDPPYPEETCTSGCPYKFGMTTEQHAHLLMTIKRIPALIMIVSYPNELYERELAGWRTFRYRAYTRRGTRTEQAWCNYPPVRVLHDPHFAGKNRREREKFARQVRNWKRNYAKLPAPQRAAIRSELLSIDDGSHFVGVCSRCLTLMPADVADCGVCRSTHGRRPSLLPELRTPRPQPTPPAAPPKNASAAARKKKTIR